MITKETKISLGIAGTHFALFLFAATFILFSADGQAPMVWIWFAYLDFPVSLLNLAIGEQYRSWFDSLSYPIPALVFYPPYFIYGILGSAWWYLLPRVLLLAVKRGKAQSKM